MRPMWESRYHHYFIESWLSLFFVITTVVSDLCCCCQCEHCHHCSYCLLPSWKCMCWALWVVLWLTCCLLLLLSFLQSILVIHSTSKPPLQSLQPTELKDHQHFRCYKTWWFMGTLHGNSPYQPVGEAIVEVFSATSRCQSRDAGGRSVDVGGNPPGSPREHGFWWIQTWLMWTYWCLEWFIKNCGFLPLEVASKLFVHALFSKRVLPSLFWNSSYLRSLESPRFETHWLHPMWHIWRSKIIFFDCETNINIKPKQWLVFAQNPQCVVACFFNGTDSCGIPFLLRKKEAARSRAAEDIR